METHKSRIHFSDVILFIIFLLLLAVPAYLCYEVLVESKKSNQDTSTTTQNTTTTTPVTDNTTKTPVGPVYTEIVREISGQTAYIAVPNNIDTNRPPAIILFSHGSDSQVISDMADPDMIDLQGYGKFFASQNFVFAASNEHGANWGNADSINDMTNLIQWIQAHYTTSKDIYLIGHSMGGLPTMHFALQYPTNVKKIALLAPTVRTYEWDQTKVNTIMNIDIHIWHGTADVNIGISNSIDFVAYMKNLGKAITLTQISGVDHYYVKTKCKDQILSFFQGS